MDGIQWNLVVSRNMSYWHNGLSSYGHFHHLADFGVQAHNMQLMVCFHGTESHIFTNPENTKSVSDAVMKAVSSEKKITRLKKKYEQHAKALWKALQQCLKKPDSIHWKKFGQAYALYGGGLFITTIIGRRGSEELQRRLQEKGYSDNKIPEIISIITYPKEHTPLFQSRLDLLEIAIAVQRKKIDSNRLEKKLNQWISKHGYIPVNFCDEPWSLSDAKKQLESLLQKDCAKEWNDFKKSHQDRVAKAAKKLKEINDPKITVLAKAIQEGTYLNEYRKNVFSNVSLHMRPLFEKIAKKSGMRSWQECYYFTHEELGQLMEGKKLPVREIVEGRETACKYFDAKGRETPVSKETKERLVQYILEHTGATPGDPNGESEVKGFSANNGKVKGVVKIVLSSKDFHKINVGDILVTTMTSVDFVPVMERAAAFITNEGGITSHAAIVAREMNKPCIIGTKNATQVLKDGDSIEVDANRGIVRRLG